MPLDGSHLLEVVPKTQEKQFLVSVCRIEMSIQELTFTRSSLIGQHAVRLSISKHFREQCRLKTKTGKRRDQNLANDIESIKQTSQVSQPIQQAVGLSIYDVQVRREIDFDARVFVPT